MRKERDGSYKRVGGGETVGNSMGGREPLWRSDTHTGVTDTGFQDKFHQYDCSEKLCTQDLPKFLNPVPMGHA